MPQLKTDADAIKYYEVILATKTEDGTANEVLKVKADEFNNTTTGKTYGATLTADSNYGKLFYIETTGGYVSGVTQVAVVDGTSGKTWTTHTAGETAPYYHYHQYNDKVDTSYAVGYDNKALKNAAYGNNILTLGAGNSFYVVTDTVVVGDLNVLTDKVIYVIGNEDGIASKVYVVDNDAKQDSTVTDPWKTASNGKFMWNDTAKQLKVLDANMTVAELYTMIGATSMSASYNTTSAGVTTKVPVDSSSAALVSSILEQPGATFTITNATNTYTVVK